MNDIDRSVESFDFAMRRRFRFIEMKADSSIAMLDGLNDEQMVLQSRNGKYRTGNVMGFLGLGQEQLVIESRFSQGHDFLFQYLLAQVFEVPNIIDMNAAKEAFSEYLEDTNLDER